MTSARYLCAPFEGSEFARASLPPAVFHGYRDSAESPFGVQGPSPRAFYFTRALLIGAADGVSKAARGAPPELMLGR